MRPVPRRSLRVWYPHRRGLLASARTEGAVLSLFVPSTEALPMGTPVTLDIGLRDAPLRFEVEGHVRGLFSARQEPGLGVVFAGVEKRAVAQMLAVCAGRSLDDGTALDSRHPVHVSCLVDLRSGSLKGALRDVSNTGAFVGLRGPSRIREQSELTLRLEPLFGRWGGRPLKARVMWVGEKNGVLGFGVRFLDSTSDVRERLKKHIEAAAAR